MPDDSVLRELGLKIPDIIAGFFGGVVNALVFRRSDPWAIVGSVVVGALTANYLTTTVAGYLGANAGAAGFVVGLAGMAICQGIVASAKTWRPFAKGDKQ